MDPANDGDQAADEETSPPQATYLWSHISLSELSGACGDLGTFVPLYVALCRQGALFPVPALFLTGIAHIYTGWHFGLPMPVQPMKALAAAALVDELSRLQLATAGLGMGISMLICSMCIDTINKWIPSAVVAGIQGGVGLTLSVKGIQMIAELPWWSWDSKVMAMVAALWILSRRNGLVLFGVGCVMALTNMHLADWRLEMPVIWALHDVTWKDWTVGILQGTLPQLPLTTLNSVISVCCLASTLYPNAPSLPSRREVCLSVGFLNLIIVPFGSMPVCHGAGGLAGQHKMGARHGTSVVLLGVFQVILALVGGTALVSFWESIPVSILSILLVLAGHELTCTGFVSVHDSQEAVYKKEIGTALITTAIIVGLHKTHYGALCGIVFYYCQDYFRSADENLNVPYRQISVNDQDEESQSD